MLFQYMCTMCNDQIRVIEVSIPSDIYHLFMWQLRASSASVPVTQKEES